WRRVMNHSTANARMAQARNIDAKAMLTSGIVTPSIVNQRAARRSLIARDCMREVNPNCYGLLGGRALERLTAVSIFEPKDYSRSRCCKRLFQREENLLIRSRNRNVIRLVCVFLCLFSVSVVLVMG